MTGTQYLLVCLAEEAAEVQKAATKALRFGLYNHHPGLPTRNRDTLAHELVELAVITERLLEASAIPALSKKDEESIKAAKFNRLLLYAKESKRQGTLDPEAIL